VEAELGDNSTKKEALPANNALFPESSFSAPSITGGPAAPEIGSGDAPMLWTQQMREGFSKIPEGDLMPSASLFECTVLCEWKLTTGW
jgi:hypothetical protein